MTGAAITPGSAGRRAAAVLDGQLTSNDPATPSVVRILRVTAAQLSRCPFTHAHPRSKSKVKRLNDIALLNKSSQSYGVPLAIWDHTVLPVTQHK